MSEWTDFDQKRATSEGWLISDRSDGKLEIQRLDEAEKFAGDAAAIAHVYWRALEGSPLHRKAIRYTVADGPAKQEEYFVSWEIELGASSAEAAAEQADAIVIDPARMGNIFRVRHTASGVETLVEVKKGSGRIVGEKSRE